MTLSNAKANKKKGKKKGKKNSRGIYNNIVLKIQR